MSQNRRMRVARVQLYKENSRYHRVGASICESSWSSYSADTRSDRNRLRNLAGSPFTSYSEIRARFLRLFICTTASSAFMTLHDNHPRDAHACAKKRAWCYACAPVEESTLQLRNVSSLAFPDSVCEKSKMKSA